MKNYTQSFQFQINNPKIINRVILISINNQTIKHKITKHQNRILISTVLPTTDFFFLFLESDLRNERWHSPETPLALDWFEENLRNEIERRKKSERIGWGWVGNGVDASKPEREREPGGVGRDKARQSEWKGEVVNWEL